MSPVGRPTPTSIASTVAPAWRANALIVDRPCAVGGEHRRGDVGRVGADRARPRRRRGRRRRSARPGRVDPRASVRCQPATHVGELVEPAPARRSGAGCWPPARATAAAGAAVGPRAGRRAASCEPASSAARSHGSCEAQRPAGDEQQRRVGGRGPALVDPAEQVAVAPAELGLGVHAEADLVADDDGRRRARGGCRRSGVGGRRRRSSASSSPRCMQVADPQREAVDDHERVAGDRASAPARSSGSSIVGHAAAARRGGGRCAAARSSSTGDRRARGDEHDVAVVRVGRSRRRARSCRCARRRAAR